LLSIVLPLNKEVNTCSFNILFGQLCYDFNMNIELMVLLISLGLISILLFAPIGADKAYISWSIVLLSAFVSALSVIFVSSLLTLIIGISFVWGLINNARLATHRRDSTNRLSKVRVGWLSFLTLIAILSVLNVFLNDEAVIIILSIISLIASAMMLIFALYHAFSYSIGSTSPIAPDSRPTLTLAYPARNETHAIEETLVSAVACEYPKLEILVIDDCSQDRTPQIIRNFAHDGVRFIEGSSPSDNWLGKNAAYRSLADEASGDFLLFSGIDVKLSPQSINKLVDYALKNNLDMLSVMPQRIHFDFLANFLQTTRYYFQYVLPWELFPISPVLSSLWLIKRETLSALGGFEAFPNTVVPERHFANALSAEGKYRFVVSDSSLGVTTRKRTSSQLETAIRTLYPMLDENPITTFLTSLSLLLILVTPFILSGLYLLGFDILVGKFALISAMLLTLSNLVVYTRFNASSWFIGLFNFPFIMISESVLLQISMIKYEFSKVCWKDRNICIPVLNPPLHRQRKNPI